MFTLTANGQTTKRSDWKVIPNNLDESLTRLDFLLGGKFKQDYQGLEEKEAVDRINFVGLGTQIRNDWKLWKGSKLSDYFNNLGVGNPEDMTHIIFTSYHRRLSNKDIDLKGQLDLYNDIKNNPEKYFKPPIDRFVVGDTVISHFYEMGFARAMTNKQGRCDLTAIVKEMKRETNQIKIELVTVTTTRPDMKYDKEKYKEGRESWEIVDGFQWRKKGEIVQIHIGR